MDITLLALNGITATIANYLPLMVLIVVLALLMLIFKLTGMKIRILWKLLINSLSGALMLAVFDVVFGSLLHMDFFYINITWINSLITGVLGIPGVILLLILKFILI